MYKCMHYKDTCSSSFVKISDELVIVYAHFQRVLFLYHSDLCYAVLKSLSIKK